VLYGYRIFSLQFLDNYLFSSAYTSAVKLQITEAFNCL
jgi:hypothetical protein